MEAYHAVNDFDVERLEEELYNVEDEEETERLQQLLDEANEGQEVFEHWAVSNYLKDKLEGLGEKVLDLGNLNIWCRTTTGQSISMDGVIELIVQNTFDEGKAKRLVQEMEEYPLLESAEEFFEMGGDYE
jgi:hypothetical protein